MDEQLDTYSETRYWIHLTLPSLLESIEQTGLETGHKTTEKQLFKEYFPDSADDDVVAVRDKAEELLENVRVDMHGERPAFESRHDCVALWGSAEQAFEMRSAVLGDSTSYGAVVVDSEKLDNPKLLLSEYQLIAQTMMHVNAYRSNDGGIDSEELVAPAWQYWRSATVTNSWDAVSEQLSMFDLPEILVHGGVPADAIVETMELDATPYDDAKDDAPPSVTPH